MPWKRTDLTDAVVLVTIVTVLLWLAASVACGEVVTRVIDGDSLILADGRHVRLAGIEAANAGTTQGKDAKLLLTMYALDRDVQVEVVDTGWGQTTAVVRWRKWDLGKSMVASGLALARGRYEEQERAARAARKGLWSQDAPRVSGWNQGNRAGAGLSGPFTAPVPVPVSPNVFLSPRQSTRLTVYRNSLPANCVGNT